MIELLRNYEAIGVAGRSRSRWERPMSGLPPRLRSDGRRAAQDVGAVRQQPAPIDGTSTTSTGAGGGWPPPVPPRQRAGRRRDTPAGSRRATACEGRRRPAGRRRDQGDRRGRQRTARPLGRGRLRPHGGRAAGCSVPAHPATLAIDIGGTGLKASVLDAEGRLLADRVRVATTYPVTPEADGGRAREARAAVAGG